MKKVVVIGAGFAGLSAACFLARGGAEVVLLEKNGTAGGRARSFASNGFTFDMGPSWYWMPEVFERFFGSFGKKVSDYYELVRLDPSYTVFWENEHTNVPAGLAALKALFEHYEAGAGDRLSRFMDEAAFKYRTGMDKLVFKPGLSITEFLDPDLIRGVFRLDVFKSIRSHIATHFRHPKLRQLLEFPVLFLGALPQNTPALYSLMNYADVVGGTWYPMGGMGKIAAGMESVALELGVQIHYNSPVQKMNTDGRHVRSVTTPGGELPADAVVAACDYHHAETDLLSSGDRSYKSSYWNSRSMAPSCLLYYVGVNVRVPGLSHHNLFFDAPFDEHADALYTDPAWPSDPLLYVCCPSQTDQHVAPPGSENLFILIPVAPGLAEEPHTRDHYLGIALQRIQQRCGIDLAPHIVYKRAYAGSDFMEDYHAFRGNAYGLSNTLRQTAIGKPAIRSHKLSNLFFAGQLTVPGPGVPPAIISGEVAAGQVLRSFSKQHRTQPA